MHIILWKISLSMTWHDLQQGQSRLTGKNISECWDWSVKTSITVSLSDRPHSCCHLFSLKTHPTMFGSTSDNPGETFTLDVFMPLSFINKVSILNIFSLNRHTHRTRMRYSKKDYHRTFCSSFELLRNWESIIFFLSLSLCQPRGTSWDLIAVNPFFKLKWTSWRSDWIGICYCYFFLSTRLIFSPLQDSLKESCCFILIGTVM